MNVKMVQVGVGVWVPELVLAESSLVPWGSSVSHPVMDYSLRAARLAMRSLKGQPVHAGNLPAKKKNKPCPPGKIPRGRMGIDPRSKMMIMIDGSAAAYDSDGARGVGARAKPKATVGP